ncbi:hypothetical protein MUP56_01400 [Patescibacteria group bacterium]|nr:hypothetical protein [Patescibacteria group bacterium]
MITKNDESQPVKKSKLPFVVVLGIGCFVIIVLSLLAFGIVFAVAGKLVFSPFGENFLKNTIEKTTGIKLENGKNGEKISITNQGIPANFPKDFPLYPDAAPRGTAIGSEKTTGKGFWLLLETSDPLTKVTSYYDEQLEGKGWIIEETNVLDDGSSYKVKKEKLIGNIIVSWDKKDAKTTILITLEPTNEGNPEPLDVGDDTSVIPEELP